MMLASYDPEEAVSAAEDDWASDSKSQETLSREAFMDAIFELADMCATPDPTRTRPRPDPDPTGTRTRG